MSLINEALRKARKESGQNNEIRLEVNASALRPSRNGVGATLVIGAVIAAIAAFGGAGAVWWLLSDRQPPMTMSVEPATETNLENNNPPVTSEISIETPLQDEAPFVVEESDTGIVDDPGLDGHQPLETVVRPTEDPDLGETALNDSAAATKSPVNEIRDFVAEVDLGVTKLNLDYILYRSNDPYAEINGTEVHVGNHIEGFVVEEITRDFVRLSDKNGPLVLRVR